MCDIFSLVISFITPIITLISFLGAIFQYKKESIRKKRSETLALYIELFNKTYNIREEYKDMFSESIFSSTKISTDPKLYKKVLTLLTEFESFAKGLEYEIYDFEIFIYLTPKEMFEILNSLKQFVYDERKNKGYELLFNDFIHLVDLMSICIQAKINNKKFPKKYKDVKG